MFPRDSLAFGEFRISMLTARAPVPGADRSPDPRDCQFGEVDRGGGEVAVNGL
jgi:hypothetical protein